MGLIAGYGSGGAGKKRNLRPQLPRYGEREIFFAPPNSVPHSAVETLIARGRVAREFDREDGDASSAKSTDADR